MNALHSLKDTIFTISNDDDFERAAMAIFLAQAEHNSIYREYLKLLKIDVSRVRNTTEIPFLPISFFKSHKIKTGNFEAEIIFTSSGTTGSIPSRHLVKDLSMYRKSYLRAWKHFYGEPEKTCILALLPNYLERAGSSLVFMAEDLIARSAHPKSGFYLHNRSELIETLQKLSLKNTPTILLGVSFALLDLAEEMPGNFTHPQLIVMETGGMKGRRKELIRSEMHDLLKQAFGVENIHAEYGMTELLSQAYSHGNGLFKTPPWMRAFCRDTADPLSAIGHEKTGGLNIIDLANVYSCSFLATEDLGKTHTDGTFEVLGRFDTAEIRGCNLMIE